MHLNAEAAWQFIEGRLDTDQEVFWTRHSEVCADCAEGLRSRRQLQIDLKRSHLISAPAPDLRYALSLFPPADRASALRLRAVVASIVFDSFRQPALAGARGNSAPLVRQMVMRAEDFDVHIKIWGEPDHRQMLGQLLARKGRDVIRSARFHLLRNGERVDSTMTDDMGEFCFVNLPHGDLSLQIDLPNLTVIGALNFAQVD